MAVFYILKGLTSLPGLPSSGLANASLLRLPSQDRFPGSPVLLAAHPWFLSSQALSFGVCPEAYPALSRGKGLHGAYTCPSVRILRFICSSHRGVLLLARLQPGTRCTDQGFFGKTSPRAVAAASALLGEGRWAERSMMPLSPLALPGAFLLLAPSGSWIPAQAG